MNDSTLKFVAQTTSDVNRTVLLRRQTRLLCSECKAVKTVVDYFPNHDTALECGHRRPVALRTPAEVARYNKAKSESRRLIQRKNGVTLWESAA